VLCGAPGTDPAGPDWRNAYAEYLIQYVRYYRQEGVAITDLGFVNEPELARPYATMQLSCEQITDLAKILGPKLAHSGLNVNLVCCESTAWDLQAQLTKAIEDDPEAARWIGIHSGHQYGKPDPCLARSPLPTNRPVWMSEWFPEVDRQVWDERWDQGDTTGMVIAENIHDALTMGNVSAYIYWFGASLGNTGALIRMDQGGYTVSKRLWAIAAYSRFIRPGAIRCAARSESAVLKISAYENPDASRVIEIINTGTTAATAQLGISPSVVDGTATTYVTDEAHSLEPVAATVARNGLLEVRLAPRSLTTVTMSSGSSPGLHQPAAARAGAV
jgi:glucosylceramidase